MRALLVLLCRHERRPVGTTAGAFIDFIDLLTGNRSAVEPEAGSFTNPLCLLWAAQRLRGYSTVDSQQSAKQAGRGVADRHSRHQSRQLHFVPHRRNGQAH